MELDHVAADLTQFSFTDLAKQLPTSTIGGVQTILQAVRSHLGMDVAFVSEFVGRVRYFRNVDAKPDGRPSPLNVGDSMLLSDGYCKRVVEGTLPELIPDTAAVPGAMALPDTTALPIGSHLSVPIRLSDGHVYGTFCCFSYTADRTLNERDLGFMRAFAEVAAYHIESDLDAGAMRTEMSNRIQSALDTGLPATVYQPSVDLHSMRVMSLECLARFDVEPRRGPSAWFAEANVVGKAAPLELRAIGNAIREIVQARLPATLTINFNASAQTITDHDLRDTLGGFPLDRVVLELTEHDHVVDYAPLIKALRPLREAGMRVAIDDAGAGYSSMSHILNINPDVIKLDISLTQRIDADRKRRALAAALIEFGRQTQCEIVAEGVETRDELETLRGLGVQMAQGYFISPPVPIDRIDALIKSFPGR
jgi:EAL domain-containing protein (putative c-di-GMP-specific phosphodiesterase class I)